MNDNDRDLRESFASLRAEESRQVRPLARVLARRPRRIALAPALAAATGLAAVAATIGVAIEYSRPKPEVSLAQWTEPTAFLMRTPGHDLLTSVPRIGQAPSMQPERNPQ